MSTRHYKTASKWAERIGLVIFASLVVQKIFLGAALTDPVLILGLVFSLIVYFLAFQLLIKS